MIEAISMRTAHSFINKQSINGKKILLVGNFLSKSTSTRRICEDLAERLTADGWQAITTSDKSNRFIRLLDMVGTTWRRRNDYQSALVDVFSGASFLWAEASCYSLKLLGKPYVLALSGGNLPTFARRWPRRMRFLLHRAARVTTPSWYLEENLLS